MVGDWTEVGGGRHLMNIDGPGQGIDHLSFVSIWELRPSSLALLGQLFEE